MHHSSWLCRPDTRERFLFTNLDFADDVAVMSEMLKILILALEILHEEFSDLGLEVNWIKTKIQASSNVSNLLTTVSILSTQVDIVDSFVVYLGFLLTCDGNNSGAA